MKTNGFSGLSYFNVTEFGASGQSRVLVLLDASASMLDETLVNVIRLRNMPDDRKLRSEKWRQAIGTVDWLSSQLPSGGQFQMCAFNTSPWPLLAGSEGRWLAAGDGKAMGDALCLVKVF